MLPTCRSLPSEAVKKWDWLRASTAPKSGDIAASEVPVPISSQSLRAYRTMGRVKATDAGCALGAKRQCWSMAYRIRVAATITTLMALAFLCQRTPQRLDKRRGMSANQPKPAQVGAGRARSAAADKRVLSASVKPEAWPTAELDIPAAHEPAIDPGEQADSGPPDASGTRQSPDAQTSVQTESWEVALSSWLAERSVPENDNAGRSPTQANTNVVRWLLTGSRPSNTRQASRTSAREEAAGADHPLSANTLLRIRPHSVSAATPQQQANDAAGATDTGALAMSSATIVRPAEAIDPPPEPDRVPELQPPRRQVPEAIAEPQLTPRQTPEAIAQPKPAPKRPAEEIPPPKPVFDWEHRPIRSLTINTRYREG